MQPGQGLASESLNIIRRESSQQALQFSPDTPPIVQKIYADRGVFTQSECELGLEHLLPPHFKGLEQAVARLKTALEQQQRILIVGDFDADGATSSALAMKVLTALGAAQVDYPVPNRFEFGYGLTPEIVEVAAQRSPDLIITVDNGIASIDGVDAANERGIDVVVTDHHLPGDALPAACAIVNPNQPGCNFPSKSLAGVGVIFYLLSALRSELQRSGWFDAQNLVVPRMADYLDLVALGTVADVVPLDRNNRILVQQGIRRIRAGLASPGIYGLLQIAKRDPARLVAMDLGFTVGPRLNAAGRLDDMSLGIRCLLETETSRANALAEELNRLNIERREIEQGMQQEALSIVQSLSLQHQGAVPEAMALYHDSWHPGVVGLVASRIKERFHRPVIAFAPDSEQVLKGSGRSIQGVHIRDMLDLLDKRHPGLILKFGGHAMAAGLSIPAAAFDQFRSAWQAIIAEQVSADLLEASLLSDGELTGSDFTLQLANSLREAGPWGQKFPEPRFDGVFNVISQRTVGGDKHLKLVLSPEQDPQSVIDAIAFNIDGEQWPNPSVGKIRAFYSLDVNVFREREQLQLIIDAFEVWS